ncbi:hypothetical protein Acr_24g0007900 [Actinidia rufa]|uniref:Uncharacterized protein n=1 Tax=Actinidia rufa TaxID=165716 RepID=A0A7J0GUT6_9ERIC|nr:hypothetical protein Acr_24g0007900 [Actinidia rufa]
MALRKGPISCTSIWENLKCMLHPQWASLVAFRAVISPSKSIGHEFKSYGAFDRLGATPRAMPRNYPEMEETIEKKKVEIENLAMLKFESVDMAKKHSFGHDDNAEDSEAEWRRKLTVKEEEIIILEAKLSKALSDKNSGVANFKNRGDLNLNKEIEVLKEQVQELERDCNELTDENLELLFKLKEASKDLPTHSTSFNSSSNECPTNNSLVDSESESNFNLESSTARSKLTSSEEEGVSTATFKISDHDHDLPCQHIHISSLSLRRTQIFAIRVTFENPTDLSRAFGPSLWLIGPSSSKTMRRAAMPQSGQFEGFLLASVVPLESAHTFWAPTQSEAHLCY